MEPNPYKPSDATLARAARKRSPGPPKPIPDSVRWGVGVYVVCFILFFVVVANLPAKAVTVTFKVVTPHGAPAPNPPALFEFAAMALTLGINFGGPALLLMKVLRRRNWARIALAPLTLLLMGFSGSVVYSWFSGTALDAVILIAAAAMVFVSVGLLFIPSSNEWFRSAIDEE